MSQESDKTDRIVLSEQLIAREWRAKYEQITGLVDQANAAMLNAQLADEQRTGKKNRFALTPLITSRERKFRFLMDQLSWGSDEVRVNWDTEESIILTDDGEGRLIDERVNTGIFETDGVGAVIQVRMVDDVDQRVLNWDKQFYRDPKIGRLYICGDYQLHNYLKKGWEKRVDRGPLKILSFPLGGDELAVSVIQIRKSIKEFVQPTKRRFRFF
jgi:hypothetical protein